MRRRSLRLLVIVAITLGVCALVAAVLQEKIIFPGTMLPHADHVLLPRGGESLWLDREEGVRIEAFFIPGDGRSASSPGPALIYTHGNYELADDNIHVADLYAPLGVSVLIVEYRGYGRSSGEPGEATIGGDMLAWREVLLKRPEVDPARVIYHGRSLGGGFAAQLADRHLPAALILESTFTSMDAMGARYLAPPFLLRHHLRTDRILPTLTVPVLVLHGTHDVVVPVSHGRRLSELRAGIEYFEGDGGHNDFPRPQGRGAYQRAITELLARHGLCDPAAAKP